MIREITLKNLGPSRTSSLTIPCADITIFVGPNNSGKSKLLSEINAYYDKLNKRSDTLLLEDVRFAGMSMENAQKVFQHLSKVGRLPSNITQEDLIRYLQDPNNYPHGHTSLQFYIRHITRLLDGASRLSLAAQPQGLQDLQKFCTGFSALCQNDTKREKLRDIIHDAFERYLVVDPTTGQLRLRLSPSSPKNPEQELGLHQAVVEFHKNAQLVAQSGDGVKAFIGIMLALIADDPGIILIDEPEAFLHPPLATKLSHAIAGLLSDAKKEGLKKTVLVATHSEHFVMGCLQSGASVNIVRLTYQSKTEKHEEVATARMLEAEAMRDMMRRPLLRSTKLLSGLFYDAVIVVEGDSDRVFYEEINYRLQKVDRGLPNCLFINAIGDKTVPGIVEKLRRFGIPAAGIFDKDVLSQDKKEKCDVLTKEEKRDRFWKKFIGCGFIADQEKRENAIKFDKQNEGKSELMDLLSQYGLYVVRVGELEKWLPDLKVSCNKENKGTWVQRIFEAMGDEGSDNYLIPGDDDVWKFIDDIAQWCKDPDRKGIPSSEEVVAGD